MKEYMSLILSPTQRNLLLNNESLCSDLDLLRLISVAVSNGENYEIYANEKQIKSMLDLVEEIIYRQEDKEKHLENLCEQLEDHYEKYIEEDPFFFYSQPIGSVYIIKVSSDDIPAIWRRVAICGEQTLHNLHTILYDSVDRKKDLLYSFFIPTCLLESRPDNIHDLCVEYTHPYNYKDKCSSGKILFDASLTTLDSLGIYENQIFFYLHDFKERWWHTITVEKTNGIPDDEDYPRFVGRLKD